MVLTNMDRAMHAHTKNCHGGDSVSHKPGLTKITSMYCSVFPDSNIVIRFTLQKSYSENFFLTKTFFFQKN